MLRQFEDPASGTLWAHTPDPAAAGVFMRRERPFTYNVTAVRFLATLSGVVKGPESAELLERARRLLVASATPEEMDNQGRFIGDFLLAVHEVGLYPW